METLSVHLVADTDDPELASPFVDGWVDGRPYRFLLDTGAAVSWVTVDEYTASLDVVGERESTGVFGEPIKDHLVVLPRLALGPIVKTDLSVVRFTGTERPNLVGMDVLGDMTMVLDLAKAQVRFASSGSLPASWPMLRSPRGHPYLELRFADTAALACWDTGAAVTQVDTAFVAAHSELFTPVGTSVGTDATGASHETPMYMMAASSVGEITLPEHRVAAVPLAQQPMPKALVLGYPALREFTWTMDFPRDRWQAVPVA